MATTQTAVLNIILPPTLSTQALWSTGQMQTYARDAIRADRKRLEACIQHLLNKSPRSGR